jgi:hypothetical protein
VFGHALKPAAGQGALWIDEDVPPRPRNIYGITKLAAEHLCELANHSDHARAVANESTGRSLAVDSACEAVRPPLPLAESSDTLLFLPTLRDLSWNDPARRLTASAATVTVALGLSEDGYAW